LSSSIRNEVLQPAAITSDLFRRACAKFATGITVVTTITRAGIPHGLTVNSFTSVSLVPPIVSICISLRCSVLPALRTGSHFGINILSEGQTETSARFAGVCEGRFDGIAWHRGSSGVPLLKGVLACFECRLLSHLDVGDHAILLGEVEHAETFTGKPLLYFDSQYSRLSG
jgi:flavin reductase (DIM6/NTAB) family NADH-FMN oxidoreductase RutF